MKRFCKLWRCFRKRSAGWQSLRCGTTGVPARNMAGRKTQGPTIGASRKNETDANLRPRPCSGVTRVGDTRGGNWGCHPSVFSWQTWRPFLVASSAVSPLISSSQKTDDLFLLIALSLFIAFTRVSPPSRVLPYTFLPVRPRFSTILCKFANKFFFLGCHPPWRVSPGAVRPLAPSPSDVTRPWESAFERIVVRYMNGESVAYIPGPAQHAAVLLHTDVVGVTTLVVVVTQSQVDVAHFEEDRTQTTDHHLRHVHEHHGRQHSRQKCIWHSVARQTPYERFYWFLSLRKILIVHDRN